MPRTTNRHADTRPAPSRVSVLLCLLVAGLFSAAAREGAAQAPPPLMNQTPEPLLGMELTNTLGQKLPLDRTFTNTEGRRVTLDRYFDGERPVVLVMMYLRCPLQCPTVMNATIQSLNGIDFLMGQDYRLLAVSFDARDTAAEAARERASTLLGYTRSVPADDAIEYLVGTRDDSKAISDALGYPFRFQARSGEFAHASGIYVITPDGRIARFLSGMKYESDTMRMALVEAGEGQVGTVIDRFVHWCFAFDPDAGSYTLAAFRVMQIGASGTALLLGTFVGVLIFKDRRRRSRLLAEQTPEGAGDPAHRRQGTGTILGAGADS